MRSQLDTVAWQAQQYRCSCGDGADDMAAFEAHLDAAGDLTPEHFEVIAGWTFQEVKAWRATLVTPKKPTK